ncbi:MAG TPA: hypothetical protein VHS96_16355, partial [Bacteroidia bacterium]|nr:hypothetical protein [Bacteroidia bacterium]
MKRIFSLMVMAIAILNGLSAQNPGDLDSTFNGLGHRIVADTTYLEFEHVAVMADGRIVAAGLYNYAFAPELWVQRYMPDGSLDTSFAHTGEVILGGYPFVGEYMGMALQPDGKVVLIATVLAQGIECHRVVRLNVDGSLDSGFGNAGQVLDPINSLSMFAFRIFVQPSGRLVAATQSFNGASAIAFLPNGTRDFSYGNWSGTGNVELSVTGSLYLTDAAMQPDGKVISLTNFQENQEDYFFLTRLTANGLPDSSFGTNGVLALYDSIYGEAQFAVDANAAGEVFVSGVHSSSINLVKAAVHKFLPDGS